VWTLLYALMAIAAWRVWQAPPSPARSWALGLFLAQLTLNLAWSWIFFRQHGLGAAMVEIVFLWMAIAAATLVFSRVDLVAAWLMAPYLAWVTFACALNAGFWRLN
jgi:tryptophan-rich sensory protein